MSALEPEDRCLPPALRRGALANDVANRWPGAKSRDFVFVEGSSDESYVQSMELAAGTTVVEVGVYPIVDWSVVPRPVLEAVQGAPGGGVGFHGDIPFTGQPEVVSAGFRRRPHSAATEDSVYTVTVTTSAISSNPSGQTRVRVVYYPPGT